LDTDVYELPPGELARLRTVPGSLDEALRELEADHEFLLRGWGFHLRPVGDAAGVQKATRGGPHTAAPPSLRVLPLLRHI